MANIELRPSLLAVALTALIKVQRPVFVWGPPGIGKSAVVAQITEALGLDLRDVRATLLDPVDLRGLPFREGGRTSWDPPVFLPTVGRGVLFLDELNSAAPSVQAACYQLILDRALGEYRLPDGWAVVAAGNRLGDRSSAQRMPSALANRFVHLHATVDLDDWSTWAINAGIDPLVVAFLRHRPELLMQPPAVVDQVEFPSPRTWSFASDSLSTGVADTTTRLAMLAGCVGQGAAVEYLAYETLYKKLPNFDSILASPDTAELPTEPSTRYAVVYSLAYRATGANLATIVRYLDRMSEEYSVLAMKTAITRDVKLTKTTTYRDWAIKHADILS